MQQVVKIESAGKGNKQRKRKIEEAASKRANDTTRGKGLVYAKTIPRRAARSGPLVYLRAPFT